MAIPRVIPPFLLALAVLTVAACSPSLGPLYRDFDAGVDNTRNIHDRILGALEETEWSIAETTLPNVVATEARTFRRWGLYSVEVELELAPINDHYVRVFVHPYRVYFTGGRSKMPFLKKSLRRSVMPDLAEALARQDIEAVGTAPERDKKAVSR